MPKFIPNSAAAQKAALEKITASDGPLPRMGSVRALREGAPQAAIPKGDWRRQCLKLLERRAITYSIDKAIESGALNCGQKYLPAIYSESKIEDGRVVVMCKGTTIGAIRLHAPN